MKRTGLAVLSRSFVLAVAGLFVSVPAAAQDKGADAQRAVSLAREAKQRYDRGDWAGALELFQVAETSAHSPVLLLYVARCERNLGHLIRARDQYGRVAAENLPPNAPEPFVSARTEAQRDLEAMTARIAKVSIDVSALPPAATIDVDGVAVARETPRLEVDPGAHVASAHDGGREIARSAFNAGDGAAVSVRLEIGAAKVPGPGSDATATRGSLVPGGLLLGAGAAGLAVGVVTRVIAFSEVSDVKSRCQDNHCLSGDAPKIASAQSLQTASTVCLAVGGAAVVAGIVLIVVRPGGRSSPVALRFGPTSIGMSGSF